MELNLLPILNFDGRKIEICEKISLSANDNDNFEILAPVEFEGYAQNMSGTIEICGYAKTTLRFVCDRCAEAFDSEIDFEISERYKKEDEFSSDEENPDIVLFSGSTIDLDEILYTNLYMNVPSKNLCKADCKGLCSECGKNLNLGDCDCNTEYTDPRFDILDKLL